MATDWRIISHKLSLLKYAKSINNVSAACRDTGVSRTTYYDYKRRYMTHCMPGLEDNVMQKPVMPNTTRADIVAKVISYAKRYPVYGAARIANELGGIVCAATVHNILKRNGLSKKFNRLLAMDCLPQDIKLSPVFARKLEAASPKRIESSRAGELVSLDTFYVCILKGIGWIYQITAYSSFGFAKLYTEKSAACAVDFIGTVVERFLCMGIKIENIPTDNGKEFISHWGSSKHVFERYLADNNIRHRYTKVRHPWTNGLLKGSNTL